jgi:hypothetical protein
MIIYSIGDKKTYETNSRFHSSDWTKKAEFIIDETNPENEELIEKVQKYAPYFEVIANSRGEVTDIIKTADKPEPKEPQNYDISPMDKIAQLEAELAELKAFIAGATEV